jgi:hypothetical protein
MVARVLITIHITADLKLLLGSSGFSLTCGSNSASSRSSSPISRSSGDFSLVTSSSRASSFANFSRSSSVPVSVDDEANEPALSVLFEPISMADMLGCCNFLSLTSQQG